MLSLNDASIMGPPCFPVRGGRLNRSRLTFRRFVEQQFCAHRHVQKSVESLWGATSMAKIYISSTYGDLIPYRQAVYRTLQRMGHQAIAMEDYVATDQRPLEKCLKDVADCDLYVGIFAWRYGYVPPREQGNGEERSITELEYRKAGETGKNRLIFLLDDKVSWPPTMMDAFTGRR